MSAYIRRIEIEAEQAYKNNPTSLDAPREVYSKAIEGKTKDLETVATDIQRSTIEADISELYISFTKMEIRFKQKKQAHRIFKEAFTRAYCKQYAKLWKVFINFYIQEGLTAKARDKFKEAVEFVDPSSEYMIWELWAEFERKNGSPNITIQQLKSQFQKTKEPAIQKAGIQQIQDILTHQGMIDYNVMNEASDFQVRRDHRPMGLFSMPAHNIHTLKGSEEAPYIPTRILYYLGVVLTDPQIFEIVESLREIQQDKRIELDNLQELEYRAIVRKYKNMDISESTLKERCEEEMKSVYSREAEQWSVMMKDFQEYLEKAGVPGFCQTENRDQLKLQRHILVLIELLGQERKEKKEKEERIQQMNLAQ